MEKNKTSKLCQLYVLLPIYLLQLCDGMNSGYPAIINPQLQEPDSEFKITTDQKSWIVSIDHVATPIVCLLSGYLQQKFGPKKILMVSCFPFFLGWLVAGFAFSVEFLYVSRLLVGIGSGFLTTTIYTTEITSRQFRGTFMMLESVLRCLGSLSTYTMGMFLRWNAIAHFSLVVPLFAFVIIYFVPESPVFLLSKGSVDEAKDALKKAHGIKYNTDEEIDLIQKNLETLESSTRNGVTNLMKNIKSRRDVWEPFIIILVLSTVQQFGGMSILTGYVVEIFNGVFTQENLKSNQSEHLNNGTSYNNTELIHGKVSNHAYITAIILGTVKLLSSISSSKLANILPRRSMYFASCTLAIISMIGFATSIMLIPSQDEEYKKSFEWASVAVACLMVFSVQLGVQPIPHMLSGELYPSDVRALCKGITRCCASVYLLLGLKLYPILQFYLEVYGTFYLFAVLILMSLPAVYFILPETKDLALENIQEYFTPQITKFYRGLSVTI